MKDWIQVLIFAGVIIAGFALLISLLLINNLDKEWQFNQGATNIFGSPAILEAPAQTEVLGIC